MFAHDHFLLIFDGRSVPHGRHAVHRAHRRRRYAEDDGDLRL